MRVLHVTPSFYPARSYGGPVELARLLIDSLSRAGVEVDVVTTDADGRRRIALADQQSWRRAFKVWYCRRWMAETVAPALIWRVFVQALNVDVIHLHATYSFPTLPTLLVARLTRTPVVWSPHGALMTHANATGRRRAKQLWLSACRLIAPGWTVLHATSAKEALEARSSLPKLLSEVVPSAVELPIAHSVGAANDTFQILFVGRLVPIKAVENLIDACSLLDQENIDFTLTIAGPEDSEYASSLRARAFSLGLDQRTRFVGQVGAAERSELFLTSACLVLPSHSENFGMVVVEALAHGLPVIASTGTPWSALRDNRCGDFVPNDPVSLSDALRRMYRADRVAMGSSARQWAAEAFSVDKVTQQMIELYGKACRLLMNGPERRVAP